MSARAGEPWLNGRVVAAARPYVAGVAAVGEGWRAALRAGEAPVRRRKDNMGSGPSPWPSVIPAA
jgi:hypothetical protein